MQSEKAETLRKNVVTSKSVCFEKNPTCLMSNVHQNDKKKFVWKRRQQEYNFQKQPRSNGRDGKLSTTSMKQPITSATYAKPRMYFESESKFNSRLNYAKREDQSEQTMVMMNLPRERNNGNALDRDASAGRGRWSSMCKISTSNSSSGNAIIDQPTVKPSERNNGGNVPSFRQFYSKATSEQPTLLPRKKKNPRKNQLGKTTVARWSSLLKVTSPNVSSTQPANVKNNIKSNFSSSVCVQRRRGAMNNVRKMVVPKFVDAIPMTSACYNGKIVNIFNFKRFSYFRL